MQPPVFILIYFGERPGRVLDTSGSGRRVLIRRPVVIPSGVDRIGLSRSNVSGALAPQCGRDVICALCDIFTIQLVATAFWAGQPQVFKARLVVRWSIQSTNPVHVTHGWDRTRGSCPLGQAPGKRNLS
jgi:hypothetical protein